MFIFISYSHVDRNEIGTIADILRNAGHLVWFDPDLFPGQDWERVISEKIQQCEVFLYALTNESLNSDYCRYEFNQAAQLQKQFLPVLLRSNSNIPQILKRFQYADYTKFFDNKAVFTARLLGGLNRAEQLRSTDYLEVTNDFRTNSSDFQAGADALNEIIHSDRSPMRVVAGPGTGKTYSVVRRVERLLHEGTDPEKILLITFSRTAARDVEKELRSLNVRGADDVVKGTLHSFCLQVLKSEKVYGLLDRVPRPLLEFEERFMREDLMRVGAGGIRELEEHQRAFQASWARQPDQPMNSAQNDRDRYFYHHMLEWLMFHEGILLDEVVPLSLRYLRANPGSQPLQMYDHILVDEYQDLNLAEQLLLEEFGRRGSLGVIGDEDQSIYQNLRYSHPEGISNFIESHPDTHDISMQLCHRCPTQVVGMANNIIKNNVYRKGHELKPKAQNGTGEVHIVQWRDSDREAEGIARYIRSRIDRGDFDPKDVLILCTRRRLGYRINNILSGSVYQIPTRILLRQDMLKGDPTTTDAYAQEAFTLLNLITNPNDRVALRCWLGFGSSNLLSGQYGILKSECAKTPLFGIGKKSPKDILDDVIAGHHNVRGIDKLIDRYRLLLNRKEELKDKAGREIFDSIFPVNQEWTQFFTSLPMKM